MHPRPQAQARAALTVALGQAVDLRRNSDAEAWSHHRGYTSLLRRASLGIYK
jgi:hypothetical protein